LPLPTRVHLLYCKVILKNSCNSGNSWLIKNGLCPMPCHRHPYGIGIPMGKGDGDAKRDICVSSYNYFNYCGFCSKGQFVFYEKNSHQTSMTIVFIPIKEEPRVANNHTDKVADFCRAIVFARSTKMSIAAKKMNAKYQA